MRPERASNANRPTDRAVMPTIHRPNDRADMPATHRPTDRRALCSTTIVTRRLHRTATQIDKLRADTPVELRPVDKTSRRYACEPEPVAGTVLLLQ